MNEEIIKTTYRGVEITYVEYGNKWTFTHNGNERSATTLHLAKEAIDAPPPKDKPPFKRIECYYGDYSDYKVVTVTSKTEIRDNYRYRSATDRGTNATYGSRLFPVTPNNAFKREQILKLNGQRAALAKQIDEIRKSMLTLGSYLEQQQQQSTVESK